MESKDDEQIMLEVRDGDLDQLSLLFQRYSGMLYAFFLNRTREHGLSEDLTQEVFLRVLRYRTTYRPDGNFRAWLFRIARNVQSRQWDRRFSRLHVLRDDSESDSIDEAPDESDERPDDRATRTDDTQALYAALERLPEEKRQLVVMRRIQDLSYEEIGQILGCEARSIKVRVHRAVAELAKHFHAKPIRQ